MRCLPNNQYATGKGVCLKVGEWMSKRVSKGKGGLNDVANLKLFFPQSKTYPAIPFQKIMGATG